jgi:hypothetical protein
MSEVFEDFNIVVIISLGLIKIDELIFELNIVETVSLEFVIIIDPLVELNDEEIEPFEFFKYKFDDIVRTLSEFIIIISLG